MLKHRVIPCLLLKNGGLVKTRRFQNPMYVGDPINAIRIFNEKEVDELIVLDIEASRIGASPNFGLLEQFASECFMPLCYGGGITSADQAQKLFSMGVEKVSLQSSAMRDIQIVNQIASRFGQQSVVVSVDVKRTVFGAPKSFESRSGRTIREPWELYMRRAIDAGAGEILLNAVHLDGTLAGMDTVLIAEAAKLSAVPIIAAGGAGNLQDLRAAVDAGASAVAAGAMFVYHGPHRAVLITYPAYDQLVALLD